MRRTELVDIEGVNLKVSQTWHLTAVCATVCRESQLTCVLVKIGIWAMLVKELCYTHCNLGGMSFGSRTLLLARWFCDFADEIPHVEVIGTDISPIQPTLAPPNL